jgi:hypothetical protein
MAPPLPPPGVQIPSPLHALPYRQICRARPQVLLGRVPGLLHVLPFAHGRRGSAVPGRLRASGKEVCVWTVNEEGEMKVAMSWGVRAVLTDRVGAFNELKKEVRRMAVEGSALQYRLARGGRVVGTGSDMAELWAHGPPAQSGARCDNRQARRSTDSAQARLRSRLKLLRPKQIIGDSSKLVIPGVRGALFAWSHWRYYSMTHVCAYSLARTY